jgi:ubiquinone/menaquinone biosynthesis C-methylase UbiE
MYDEASDFLLHKKEVDDCIAILTHAKVPLAPVRSVLDIGAGQGMHAGFLSTIFERVHCADVIDYSSLYGGEFLKLLDEKHRRNGYSFALNKISFNQTDATALLYRDSFFDLVISINAFEHIRDPGLALEEAVRVTKPGGHIFISLDPIWTADTGNHFFHRVSEPWAHLLYPDELFVARMLANGASEPETMEYQTAMNRLRAADYQRIVDLSLIRGEVKLLYSGSWSGVVAESHASHPNLRELKDRGYSAEELFLRGLRWVFQRM